MERRNAGKGRREAPIACRPTIRGKPERAWKEKGLWKRERPQVGKLGPALQAVNPEDEDCRETGDSPPAEPLRLGKEEVEFLVSTGATYSVLNTCKGKLSKDMVNVNW